MTLNFSVTSRSPVFAEVFAGRDRDLRMVLWVPRRCSLKESFHKDQCMRPALGKGKGIPGTWTETP